MSKSETTILEREDDVALARGVELEVGGLPRLDHAVLVVLHHHEVLEAGEVDGVGLVLDSLLVVDLRDELALLHVGVEVQGVVPVLRLHQETLHEVHIGAVVQKIPGIGVSENNVDQLSLL